LVAAIAARRRAAVEYIRVDVHKRDGQVCILAENGDILVQPN
jgi:hypothetical protein